MFRDLFYAFMKKVRLFVTIFVAIFIVGGVYEVLGTGTGSFADRLGGFICILICGMIMYLIIYYWYGKNHKCPACKKRFCLKKTGEEIVGRENISVLVETRTRNKNGEVIGSQEQYVPGERITYRINKVCRKCGKSCYSTYERDVPKV